MRDVCLWHGGGCIIFASASSRCNPRSAGVSMLTAPQVEPTQGGDAFWNRGPRQRRKEVIHVDGPHRVGATRLRDVYAEMLWIFVPIQEQGRKVRGHCVYRKPKS